MICFIHSYVVLLPFDAQYIITPPPVVVNGAAVLYALVAAEQTVCTWNWYAVPAVSPVKLLDVVAMPLSVVHVDDNEAFHWRLYVTAPGTALQLTIGLVLVSLEEAKTVGVPQLTPPPPAVPMPTA